MRDTQADGKGQTLLHSWGAKPAHDEGVDRWSFALWAPSLPDTALEIGGHKIPMQRDQHGVHRCVADAPEGSPYRFRCQEVTFADPASLWQPEGEEGPSRLLSGKRLGSRKARRTPPAFNRQVISELHIGTFTQEGTFAAAARASELRRMADLGITAIELMPLGQFPGERGWGYDSVLPFAPQHSYGSPDDLVDLVDTAHALGLSVYLDVVFNHFGPVGCALTRICPEFFHDDETEWGRKINFGQARVRDYFTDCALHWLEAYHFDGLRFDAIHTLDDGSRPPIAEDLARRIRSKHPDAHLMAEDSDHLTHLFEPGSGLYDARWDDDYHHALHVLLTGETFGYYKDFRQAPLSDLALSLRDGQTLQGQPRPGQDEPVGAPSAHLPAPAFIKFNLNHDHAGNRPQGQRLISLVGPSVARAAHALLLTSPYVPLLFMGEEVGSESPFPFFADYSGKVASDMQAERKALFKDLPDKGADMLDPFDPATAESAWPYPAKSYDADDWRDLTGRLLHLRHEVLQPLFALGRKLNPTVAIAQPKALKVDWHFQSGTLRQAVDFSHDSGPPNDSQLTSRSALVSVGDTPGPWFRLWFASAD